MNPGTMNDEGRRMNEKKRRLEDKKLEGWKEEWEWQRIYCLTFGSKFDIFFLKR